MVMNKSIFSLFLLSTSLMLALSTKVFAGAVTVNVDENDVAVGGYDTVAYFTEGLANEGRPHYTAVYKGAIYRFESKKNRDLFRAAPAKYVPQYGGHCAFGVTKNRKFAADPTAWHVVDGKLYLNFNKKMRDKWRKDIAGNVDEADEVWPGISGSKDEDLEEEFPVFTTSNDEQMKEFW